MTPAATNLDFVSVQVSDLDASARFYTETLLFERGVSPNDHAMVFKTEAGAIFAIRKPLIDLGRLETKGGGIALWFLAKEVDSLYEHVRKQGAKIVKEIADGPFGPMFVVADPDGYLITFHGR